MWKYTWQIKPLEQYYYHNNTKIKQNDTDDVDEPAKKKIRAKVVWYFPIIPCLKRLLRNKAHAKLMWQHKEEVSMIGC
jgi:hypothetical protein